jgi:hypothetical protein
MMIIYYSISKDYFESVEKELKGAVDIGEYIAEYLEKVIPSILLLIMKKIIKSNISEKEMRKQSE